MTLTDGRKRVVIERVRPEVDGGQYPIKRVVGEQVVVEADIFVDGHDVLTAMLQYRRKEDSQWNETAMQPLVNDRWQASFTVDQPGTYVYCVAAWTNRFATWHRDFRKRVTANQFAKIDMLTGAELIEATAAQTSGSQKETLDAWLVRMRSPEALSYGGQLLDDEELFRIMLQHSDRKLETRSDTELAVEVDPVRSRFSAWYELFPRSCGSRPGQHGTLNDVVDRLPYVAEMGFDILYLPPVHPIGDTFRKGKNNTTEALPGDVGSPWAIGSKDGGHKSIHPDLGTLEDFDRLVAASRDRGLELAMDIAFQCAPDHPYVTEHPQWFCHRPDGSIQYAENPPKKYQDIYPFDFECEDWRALWEELKSVFEFWIDRGVSVFRVDNPHTKPFPFWQWCIGEIKKDHPNTIFLAEAFTRPKIMHRLAKLGFTQSYTYFAWRNTKHELTSYVNDLTQTEVREFFRPNFWPNTPDILPEYLQVGGIAAFKARLVLAATLSSNYGIYGPTFEHCWSEPVKDGSEEYNHSEKYQVHQHDLGRSDSLKNYIARVNYARRELSVLQTTWGVQFHDVDNDQLICYSKKSPDRSEIVLVVVNLDPHHTQSGWINLPLEAFGLDPTLPYQMYDLLSDARYLWNGPRNYVELKPYDSPAHLFQLRRRETNERNF